MIKRYLTGCAAMEEKFLEVYDKFKLEFFRRIFELVRERDGSLSAMEAFSIEVIHALHEPTIGEFAEFLNISQSNATYKVNNLIKKGYLIKQNSEIDRREYHLVLSDKYYSYTDIMRSYIDTVMDRVRKAFSLEELSAFTEALTKISDELMPEAEMFKT